MSCGCVSKYKDPLTPPTIDTQVKPSALANFFVSLSICWANSRVGVRMRALSFLFPEGRGEERILFSIGRPYPRVFPEPFKND